MIVKFSKELIYAIESMYCGVIREIEFDIIYCLSKKCIENQFLINNCKQAILRYKKRNDLVGLLNYVDNAIILTNKKSAESCSQTLFFDCKKLIDQRAEPIDDLYYFAISAFGLQKLIDTHQMDYYKAKNFWAWCCNEAAQKVNKKTQRGKALFPLKIVVDNTLQRSNIDDAKQNLDKIKSIIKIKSPA